MLVDIINKIFPAIWLLVETKHLLFWLYLWQLKDYHFGRFIDHLRTHQGRKIFLNPLYISKLGLLILFFWRGGLSNYIPLAIFLLYLSEIIRFFRTVLNKSFKKPTPTKKILFLGGISFSIIIIFLINCFSSLHLLLIFDILISIIISFIVLILQPLSVLIRKNILKEAGKKIGEIKKRGGLQVIAIVGSYGKTSTKEFLATILSQKYKVLKTPEHQNSEIGIANCILQDLEPDYQFFIAEIGAYNKGKIGEVSSILKPDIGIVTGVNQQHLALFGSMKNLLSAEGGEELAMALHKNGLLVLNGDNKYCLDLYKKADINNKKIYVLNRKDIEADEWAEEIEVKERFISFIVRNKNKEMEYFRVNVLGKHNAQNLLAAILVAREVGMSLEEITNACQLISEKEAGMVLKKGKNGINIIDSSYSANPDGVLANLDYLSIFPGKKIIVMPCLIELGSSSSEVHKKIGRRIGEVCDMAIITTKDKFKEIKEGFDEAQNNLRNLRKNEARCLLCDRVNDIYSLINLFAKPGDAVLLEGRIPPKLISLLFED